MIRTRAPETPPPDGGQVSPTNVPRKDNGLAPPGTDLSVKVQPKASRNQILGFRGGVLQVKVTASPERGRANAALIKLLSGRLGLPRSSIRILSGHTSRDKRLALVGLSIDELELRIKNERRVEL